MPALDVKKIITSFLVLSIAFGTAAFVFSSFSLPSAPEKPSNITASAVAPDAQSTGTSTFQAESLPENAFADVFPTSTAPINSTSTNLTDQIANSLAGAIIQANPNGPQTAEDGSSNLAIPSDLGDAITKQVTEKSLSFISIPLQEEKIHIVKNYTPQDFEKYFTDLKAAIDMGYVKNGIAKLANNTGDISTETVAAVNLVLSQAENKLYGLPAPAPVEKLHRALLAYVVYQKTVFDPAMVESDPMRSLALAQNYSSGIQVRTQVIQNEMDALKKNPPLIQNKKTGLLEKLFLPQTAYAIFGVGDISFDPPTEINTFGQWMKYIAEWLLRVALNTLRQQIIHRIVMQTVNWINGGGKPQFITNWEGFLEEAGTGAANSAISALNDYTHGQLCSSFGPLITLQLQRQYLTSPPAPTCTLDRIVRNVENFYSSFENGGWIAYGALTSPSGNYYGSTMQAQISVAAKIQSARGAANANATANKGFPGQKSCVQYGKKVVHHVGQDAIAPRILPNGLTVPGSPGSAAYDTTEEDSSNCTQYQTLTPGGTIAAQLDGALGSSITNIISAQDIASVIDALINSALQKLVKFTTTGLTGLLKGDQNAPSGIIPSSNMDVCVGLTGDEYDQCKGITGASASTTSSGTDISGDQQSLVGAVKSNVTRLQDILDEDSTWISLADSTVSDAQQLSTVCETQSAEASSSIQSINTARADVQTEIDTIKRTPDEVCSDTGTLHSWLGKFQCLQSDIMSAKTADELAVSSSFLNQYTQQTQDLLGGANTVRTTRDANLKNLKNAIDVNMTDPPASCGSQALPTL